MKDFIAAELINIDDTSEGIYAGSGSSPSPIIPVPEEPGHNCWINWKCTWTGHNNGHHSVCHVSANHCGDHSGSSLVIHFTTNFPISEVKNASGLTISNVGLYNFTLTRNNFFNPSDNIGFNFEIVTSAIFYDAAGKPLAGAIGENNASAYTCRVAGYTCG